MKERPILFSGPMVRALLAGTKTQTRRLVNPQPEEVVPGHWSWPRTFQTWDAATTPSFLPHCPYGQPGVRLWVRETWRTAKSLDALNPHGMANKAIEAGWARPWAPIKYEADDAEVNTNTMFGAEWGKTRVSIHMPRWASRLTLDVTEVRVQRLQEISEQDAVREGIPREGGITGQTVRPGPREHFASLWDSINGERAGWASNPWVWAVSFRVVR